MSSKKKAETYKNVRLPRRVIADRERANRALVDNLIAYRARLDEERGQLEQERSLLAINAGLAETEKAKAAAARIAVLTAQRGVLIPYVSVKVAEGDWCGASDACNDLRTIDSEVAGLRRIL